MSVAPIGANALALVGSLCRKRPRLRKGCRCGSVMSVALIGANTLALVPCVPLMLPLPWLLLELSEGTSQEPQQRERNQQQGNRNALALWLCDACCFHCRNVFALVLPDLTEGNEPATTREGKESQRGNHNGLALPELFPESVHGCGTVAVVLLRCQLLSLLRTFLPWLFRN